MHRKNWHCRVLVLFLAVLAGVVPRAAVSAGVDYWTQYYGSASDSVRTIRMLPGHTGVLWLAANGVTTNESGSWVSNNTYMAFFYELDPTNPDIRYFGTMPHANFFKTIDGGINWIPMLGLPDAAARCLAIDPVTPTILYAGTGDGLVKSADGCGNWDWADTGMPSIESVYDIEIDPSNPAVLYAAAASGLYKSANGAENWIQVGSGIVVHPLTIAFHPADPETVFVGTANGAYVTPNGGSSWYPAGSELSSYAVYALAIDPVTPTTMYAGTMYGGVFKSWNSGSTWTSLNYALDLSGTVVNAIAVDPSIPANIYIGLGAGGVLDLEQTPDPFGKSAPSGGVNVPLNAALSWGISSGASSYEYCVDASNNDACDTGWVNTGTDRAASPALANHTTYYWQIRAVNPNGIEYANEGNWRSFNAREQRFADVPIDYWAWAYIDSLFAAGITGGCAASPLRYCPAGSVTRAQMAIFLERGINGSTYSPPPATGTVFGDVPASYWAAGWIEKLAADGITGGCGGGNYCPNQAVTRAEMALFLLRAEHGPSYTPPAAAGTVFLDVPISHWAAAWIEQLYAEGITGGCASGDYYCPNQPVTRAEMAVFLVRTFGLP